MGLRKLTKLEADAIESLVDRNFSQTPLPAEDLNTGRWRICNAAEDIHRFALMEVASHWHKHGSRPKRAMFVALLDSYKYSLRYSLELLNRKLPLTPAFGPKNFDGEVYLTAIKLLYAAKEYSEAVRFFSSFHALKRDVVCDEDTGAVSSVLKERDSQYGSLELLLGTDTGDVTCPWVFGPRIT